MQESLSKGFLRAVVRAVEFQLFSLRSLKNRRSVAHEACMHADRACAEGRRENFASKHDQVERFLFLPNQQHLRWGENAP